MNLVPYLHTESFPSMLAHLFLRCLAALGFIPVLCSCSMIQQHSRPKPPSGFVTNGPAPSTESITFRIALANNNLDGLKSKLLTISDPLSSEYGRFLTQSEVSNAVLQLLDDNLKG